MFTLPSKWLIPLKGIWFFEFVRGLSARRNSLIYIDIRATLCVGCGVRRCVVRGGARGEIGGLSISTAGFGEDPTHGVDRIFRITQFRKGRS